MAVSRKMIAVVKKKQGLYIVSAFLIVSLLMMMGKAYAAPPSLSFDQTEWRTGGLDVTITGAVPGYRINLYVRKWDTDYELVHSWIATSNVEQYTINYLENGQTYWLMVEQVDPITGEKSEPAYGRQTPPITAYIINWPEILQDLYTLMDDLNNKITDLLTGIVIPSPGAIGDLNLAIDNLKDALGIGQVGNVGTDIQTGLDDIKQDLNPPVIVDDGQGTFTGGRNPGQSPFTPGQTGGQDINLEYPNPDSGTTNDFTIRIPYGVDMEGNLLYVKIFTDEQLEKMKWIGLLRDIASATIYILFCIWLIARFAPQLKS